MVGINLAVLIIVVAGTVTGIRGYVADTLFTYHAVTCCGSVCSQCFFTMHTFFTALPWLCIVKLFIARIFHALNFFLPVNSYLLNGYIAAFEMAADDAALHTSGEPLELASALVKLSRYDNMDTLSLAALFSKGTAAVEDRLRRLPSPETSPPCRSKAYWCLASVLSLFTVVSICLTLFHQSFTADRVMECKTKVCHTVVRG